MDEYNELKFLKERLIKLEENLRKIIETAEQDIQIARELQRLLMPNRLPKIQGIHCLAKYISAYQLASEGYDIIPAKNGKDVWIIHSMTDTYGLSAALLGALVHFQSENLLNEYTELSPQDVFNELSIKLCAARKSGHFKIRVFKLNVPTLKVEGCSIGFPPILKRKIEHNQALDFEWISHEIFEKNPDWLRASSSAAPVLAENAYHFSFSAEPSARYYLLGSAWNSEMNLTEWTKPLQLKKISMNRESRLLDDINELLIHSEDFVRSRNESSDLSCIAFEIEKNKLHLA